LGLALLAPLSCGKVYNSSSYDSDIYGEGGGGTPEFQAAQAILRDNCATCHTQASHQTWGNISEAQFIAQGLVVPGSLSGSQLYTKIAGNSTGIAGNMPPSGGNLNSTQLQTIETWINNIQ
jgi:mono/diheme cytochrome c family protein